MSTLLGSDKVRLLDDLEKKHLKEKFKDRMEFAQSPIYLAAALLDPSNQGCHLSDSDQITAMEFIFEVSKSMGIEVMTDLALYRSKEDIWGKEFLWSNVSSMEPLIWWKGLCANKNLSKVAARILSAPVTSAATERSFSTFSWIHNKKRNRLTTERAGKLTCIAHNWNIEFHAQTTHQNVAEEKSEPGSSSTNIHIPSESEVEKPRCSYSSNPEEPSTSKSTESVECMHIDELSFSSDSD